jgi:uncharacterized protein involved in exopolysaccharide biosynthesis
LDSSPQRSAENRPVDDLGFLAFLKWLWANKYVIAGGAGLGAVIGLILTLLATPVYTAIVTILPQQDNSDLGMLGQLAMFAGIALDEGGPQEELYPKIVTSDRLLDELIDSDRLQDALCGAGSLYDALGIDAGHQNSSDRLKRSLRQKVIRFNRDKTTGFMELRASVPRCPKLASVLANELAGRLDHLNRELSQGKAREQRVFVEGQEQLARDDLEQAEEAVAEFVRKNRSYQSSPDLLLRYNQLARDVDAKSAIWIELKKQLEAAKIEEHKNLVSVDVLDAATPPSKPSSPNWKLNVLLGFMLGAVLSAFALMLREQMRSQAGADASGSS